MGYPRHWSYSAGTYQVRVKLEECHPDGCNINAHFPGREIPVKLYAVSSWRPIRVIGADDVVTSSTPTPIVTLTASAPSVASGNSVVLRWNATNAQRCVLQHSNEEDIVSLTGSKIIMPEERKRLTCCGVQMIQVTVKMVLRPVHR